MSNADPELRQAYNKIYWETHRETLIPKNRARRKEILEERRAKDRAYNLAHRAEKKAYRETHKEQLTAYHKAHYAANREKILARHREIMADPLKKEKKAAQAKAYHLANPEKLRERSRKYNLEHREQKRNQTREWRAKNPNRQRLKRHGLTEIDYKNLLGAQGGNCAICKTSNWGKWGSNIDHDHVTGKVRGILCGDCNRALGLIRDSPKTALAMAKYLDPEFVDYERKWEELVEITAARTDQAKGAK